MKFIAKLSVAALVLILLAGIPSKPHAKVLMTGNISGFGFDIMPTANFTLDGWLNTPGLWTITIINGAGVDGKPVKSATIIIDISSGSYGRVFYGELSVVGRRQSFITELPPGGVYTVSGKDGPALEFFAIVKIEESRI